MSTPVNLGTCPQTAEELLPPPVGAGEATPIAAPSAAVAKPILPAGARRLPFGRVLSPDRALHQGILSLADQAVASATNFTTGIIIARTCSQEELGLYTLGFSVILLVTDLQTSLISTPYMVYAPRLKARAQTLYTGSTLLHQLSFSLVIAFVLLCGAIAATRGAGPRGLGPVLWSLVAAISLIAMREYARRACFARLKLLTAFLFDVRIAIGQVGGLLLLARFDALSASRAYWVTGSACGIALLWWLWSDRMFYHPRIDESLADLKKNWVFGKWVFASGLVWAFGMNLYPWFLAAFHGAASTGIWAACLGVASVGNPALLGIQNLVGPKIAREYAAAGPAALRRLVLKITAAISLPVSLLCLVLILFGGRLISLVYGNRYAGNNKVVAILMLSVLISAPGFCFSRALYACERADLDFLANFAALFVMITLGFWLVRAFGPLGAAFGLLAGNVATSAIKAGAYLRIQTRKSKVRRQTQ
jgi:O-antigen/teichoic acid export membrane protein